MSSGPLSQATMKVVNDSEEWWLNGLRHREDGPAIESKNGGEEWWLNGKRHREDGPAIRNISKSSWFCEGLRHREDGPPAVELRNGSCKWWLLGNELTQEEYIQATSTLTKHAL